MEKHVKWLVFIVLLISSMLSGCFYATRAVSTAGVRSEMVENRAPEQILISEDGAIALKIQLVYVAPSAIDNRNGTVTDTSWKYLVGSRNAVECSINNALKSDFTQRQLDWWKDRLPENILYLTSFPYDIVDDQCGWQLIPSSFGGSDATVDMLPATFKPARKLTHKDNTFTLYKYHDIEYALSFSVWNARGDDKLRKGKRLWWGYPLQILAIPAIPFDILTWPFQCLMMPKFIDG